MGRRLQLQALLEQATSGLGKVYFQPPTSIQMDFPCIVYHKDYSNVDHADDSVYRYAQRYLVTVVDRNPDSEITERVKNLPMCTFQRYFAKDNLNHDNFILYF